MSGARAAKATLQPRCLRIQVVGAPQIGKLGRLGRLGEDTKSFGESARQTGCAGLATRAGYKRWGYVRGLGRLVDGCACMHVIGRALPVIVPGAQCSFPEAGQ